MNTCERSGVTGPHGARAAKCRMVTRFAGTRTFVAPADKQWGHGIYAVPNRLEWNPAILEDAQGIRQGVALRPPASPMQEPVLLGGAVRGVRGVFPLLHVAPADKQWGTAFMRCPTA
jgi:hypothetical protein